ncbi:MAG TPA: hypothetical protein VN380_07690, partial [Thermoanaerobaculia bacterium]|nr:hypothetical protein [Thermoanaerobaculia bacterium]
QNAGLASPENVKKTIQELGMKYQLVTDYTSMIVLADGDFAKRGIARTNGEWISVEEKARAARVSPTMNRADAERPMFNGPAYTTKGGGAVDPLTALLALTAVLGVAVERRRRSV